MPDPRRTALEELIARRDSATDAIRRALQPIIPPGFTGKFTVTVDNGTIAPHAVAVELRSPNPGRAVMS